ncbi:hypothetical protein EDC04DRAFT_2586339, partial [Pisolithus marmoratus]
DPLAMYEGMQYGGGEKTPLQRIAFRLFAICANSVSCECLFSMFGLTLTRLCSRLCSEAMTSLAELQLHLQDEHVRSGEGKRKLKLCATTYSTASLQHGDSTTSQATTSSTPLEPQLQSSLTSPQASTPPVVEDNLDTTPNPGMVEGTTTESAFEHNLTITEIVSHLIASANDPENNEESILSFEKLKISELFQFSNAHWLEITKTVTMRGLQEELELYELVELDAEGVPDDDPGLDSMTAAVISQM